MAIHSVICKHTSHWVPPTQPLRSPQGAEVSKSPFPGPGPTPTPTPALTKPVTCGKPEQEHKVDKHEATQVSQDHLQERAACQNRAQAQAGPMVNVQPKWDPSMCRKCVWWVVVQMSHRNHPQLPHPHPLPTFVLVAKGVCLVGRGSSFREAPKPGSSPDCLIGV